MHQHVVNRQFALFNKLVKTMAFQHLATLHLGNQVVDQRQATAQRAIAFHRFFQLVLLNEQLRRT